MIVAGFGFRSAATEDSLSDALQRALDGRRACVIATAEAKAGAPALTALVTRLALPLIKIDAESLSQQDTQTQSSASEAAYDTGSVAEAAALAAAGKGAKLLGPRVISIDRLATCALATGDP